MKRLTAAETLLLLVSRKCGSGLVTGNLSRLRVVPGTGEVIAFWMRSTARILHRSLSISRLNRELLPTLVVPIM